MTYERELTFALRLRGLRDDEIAAALEVARVHVTTARSTMEDELGTPLEYAAQFPRSRRLSFGRRFTIIVTIATVAYVIGALVFHLTPLPAFGIFTLGAVGGVLLDYLRPVPRPVE